MDTLEKAIEEERAPWTDVELETRDYIVFKNQPSATPGHVAIVPRIANENGIMKCFKYAITMGYQNTQSDNDITGYTIAMNVGESSGQTIQYPFVTLIPYHESI